MTIYTRDTTLSKQATGVGGIGAEFRSGTVTLAINGALPSGVLTLSGGSLLVGVTQTLYNDLSVANAGAPAPGGVSAKHGVTATFNGVDSIAARSALVFGGVAGADGVVVLTGDQLGSVDPVSAIDIRGGTVRVAGRGADNLFAATAFTSIQEGATLDINGRYVFLSNFASLGSVIGRGTLALAGTGTLGGMVSTTAVAVSGSTTVTGVVSALTFVDRGGVLQIGAGGTTGSATLASNNGSVLFDRSDAVTVADSINGEGSVSQIGTGTLTLTGGSGYTGGTTVSAGVLVDASYSALGTGAVTVTHGGELVVLNSQVFANALTLDGGVLAAGRGSFLGLTGAVTVTSGSALTVGDKAHDGVVVFDGRAAGQLGSLTVAAGTFAFGPHSYTDANSLAAKVTIAAGATLDLDGQQETLANLGGKGVLTNTEGQVRVMLDGADFFGTISGALTLAATGQVALHGAVALSGAKALTINPDATLTLDKPTSAGVFFYHPVAPGRVPNFPEHLVLNDSVHFGGLITDWLVNDTVDLRDIPFKKATGQLSLNSTTHVLSVSDGVRTAHLNLDDPYGDYKLSDFTYQDDGAGHVLVLYHAGLASAAASPFG